MKKTISNLQRHQIETNKMMSFTTLSLGLLNDRHDYGKSKLERQKTEGQKMLVFCSIEKLREPLNRVTAIDFVVSKRRRLRLR